MTARYPGVLRSLITPRRAFLGALLVATAVAVGFGVNALLRPGCSMLPVALPNDPDGRNVPGTLEQACAALGRPLPEARVLPPGVERDGVYIGSAVIPGTRNEIPRDVSIGYRKDGKGIAVLDIRRGEEVPTANIGELNGTVGSEPAIVTQRHITSLDSDDVSYLWAHGGLLLSLHVQLAPGITREAADAMAASVR